MASFYSNSENERDTSTILQLREQMPNSYSEGLLSGNMMMYMNNYSSSAGLYTSALPVNTHQQTNCIAIMPGGTDSSHSHQEILSQMGTSRIEGNVINEWKDSRSNLMLMHQLENAAAAAAAGGGGGIFQGTQNLQGQGLSLTLGTHVPSGFHMSSSFQNQNSEPGFSSIMCANQSLDGDTSGGRLGNVHSSTTNQESRSFDYMPHGGVQASNFDLMRSDVSPYGILSGNRPVPSPKYLKAAQELLDEVVNVKTALKGQNIKSRLMKDSKENDGKTHIGGSDPNGSGSSPKQQQESSSNSTAAELSASEKQELQNKLNKLLEMLDEVDRRYKQYYHQMQIVVSSFDIVAGGSGASKPYTALALQTISRHFRCLRDAITEQIQTARKSLGDQDASAINKGIGISRLRYIDQHIRQGRGIQQLGMMQQHAWRPQRGLPESSVSILRAWLFEHFLHPYPKDSDKMMLARQTGLSRSQVSNWFINARVRLWKPMVEEMYKEELGDVEMDANSPSEFAANKATSSDAKACEDNRGDDLQQSTTSTSIKHPSNLQVFDPQSCHLSDAHWAESRIENTVMETENVYRLGKARQNMNDCNNMLLQDSTFVQSNESNDNRLMAAAYHISELGRFENGGSGVSLTLGLQQCEGGGSNVPMSIETHQNYTTMRDGMYSTTNAPSVEGGEYDCLDSGNRHHRFSSSQLLHDFVA